MDNLANYLYILTLLMDDFFKYLTAGDEDKDWGLYLNVSGKARIAPNSTYPSVDHPSGYYFSWEKGRILQEFQVNYISDGEGELQTETGNYRIKPGTLMLIPMGCWHRYRPRKQKGWTEHYAGFSGIHAEHYFNKIFHSQKQEILFVGIREEIIDTYYRIFDLVREETPGYQQIASGLILKLLGYIVAIQKQRNFNGKPIEKIIQHTKFQLKERLSEKIDMEQLATEHQVGYSYFRKMFKQYTGVSPGQYLMELKILRARELLLTTNQSIKEISYEIGFSSVHYFSKYFKKKTGINPSELRLRP